MPAPRLAKPKRELLVKRSFTPAERCETKPARLRAFIMSHILCSMFAAAMVAAAAPAAGPARLPAFPGAEGFGAAATGGRGGKVFHVTTLDDAGPGSFRDSVSHGKRVVVFDVAGVIRLKSEVLVASDLTLAGQSAPGQGICLYGQAVSLKGSTNVITRYLRFRAGAGSERGKAALNVTGGGNLIFDHVSLEWGRWGCLAISDAAHDLTVQYCLLGEGLAPQNFGGQLDSAQNATLSHNLWINNQSRTPKCKGNIQYINNVVCNWGEASLVGGHSGAKHHLDIIGNYFIKGPSSEDRFFGQFTGTDNVFQQGNLVDLDTDAQLSGRPVVEEDFNDTKAHPTFVKAEFLHPAIKVTVQDATEACHRVLAGAGCSRHRDAVDNRLAAEAGSFGRKGRMVTEEEWAGGVGTLEGGKPELSSAGDGIADAWKTAHGLDPKAADVAKGDYNHDGYPNLEKYLNDLAGK